MPVEEQVVRRAERQLTLFLKTASYGPPTPDGEEQEEKALTNSNSMSAMARVAALDSYPMKKALVNFGWLSALRTVSKGRRRSLVGDWSGLVWPKNVSGVPAQIPVKFHFNSQAKIITGEMSFISWDKNRGVVENDFVGGFHSDSDLEFTYTKKEDGVMGWGALFLKLSPDAKKITAKIVGVSSHTGIHFYSEGVILKGKRPDLKPFGMPRLQKPTVFIGHGRADAWQELAKHLRKAGYKVETYESGARAGRAIHEVLSGMLDASAFALLVMTGEDKTNSGTIRARQNVVYEIGLFHAKLGTNRAVVLFEEGVESFSNISGVTYIPFNKNKISTVFKEVLATIRREFPSAK